MASGLVKRKMRNSGMDGIPRKRLLCSTTLTAS